MEKADFANERSVDPLPTDIGREFVRCYYKKWSMNPSEVYQFYGHESFFSHDGIEAKGQENIQDAIEKLCYEECKARIHQLTAATEINDSLLLQVCGELSVKGDAPRRFLQSFVLCKQTPKTYFVQNDIFQWLDKAFCNLASRESTTNLASNAEPVREKKKKNKEHAPVPTEQVPVVPQQNGHSVSQPPTLAELSSLASHQVREPEKKNVVENSITAVVNNNPVVEPQNVSNNFSSSKGPTPKFAPTPAKNRARDEQQHQQHESSKHEHAHPKTWARAVSNSTASNNQNSTVNVQSPIAQKPVHVEEESKPKDNEGSDSIFNDNNSNNRQPYKEKRGGFHNGGGGFRGGFQRGPPANRGGGVGGGGRPNYGNFRNTNNPNFFRGGLGGNDDGGQRFNNGQPPNNDRRGPNTNTVNDNFRPNSEFQRQTRNSTNSTAPKN